MGGAVTSGPNSEVVVVVVVVLTKSSMVGSVFSAMAEVGVGKHVGTTKVGILETPVAHSIQVLHNAE